MFFNRLSSIFLVPQQRNDLPSVSGLPSVFQALMRLAMICFHLPSRRRSSPLRGLRIFLVPQQRNDLPSVSGLPSVFRLILVLVGVLVLLGTAVRAEEGKPVAPVEAGVAVVDVGPEYLLGPGDVVDISLWKDEALTRSVTVLPDGKISFPLIGEIRAAGRTVAQIKKEVEEKISAYVPDPTLSVEVKQVNSMLIYVIGRVNTSGRFALNTNVNVMQALAMAGGLNPFAKRDKIKIFRYEGGGKPIVFAFSYDKVVDGVHLEQNIVLRRGDVVVVP